MRGTRNAALAALVLLAACSAEQATTTPETTTTTGAPTTTTAPPAMEALPALASDQPCTRTSSGAPVAAVGFHLEDLAAMVPTRAELGAGLDGFAVDVLRHGYQGNRELRYVEINPADTCEDLERFGRIIGFGAAFTTEEERPRRVLASVHLFWEEDEAADWLAAFVEGLGEGVGTPDGPTRMDVRPADELGPGALMIDHEGPQGVRSWAILQRGPIVGWVTDVHPGPEPTIDVMQAARVLGDRIEAVTDQVRNRSPEGLDAAALISVPLPSNELGEPYSGYEWNDFWGGCTDIEEMSFIQNDAAADAARRWQRVSGCTAMYGDGPASTAWSRIETFPDAARASGYLAEYPSMLGDQGLQPFTVDTLDHVDETYAVQLRPQEASPDAGYWHTRVAFRLGPYLATVAINGDGTQVDQREQAVAVAGRLQQRLMRVLAADAP